MSETISQLLGLGVEPKNLSFIQISLRGIIVFFVTLIVVRVANKRFLAKLSPLDAILGFILAATLSRAVNGSASFFPTLGAGFVIVALHRFLAYAAFRFPVFGEWLKGRSNIMVKDGQADLSMLKRHNVSEQDLLEEARLNGQVCSTAEIGLATMERNGQISIIPRKSKS